MKIIIYYINLTLYQIRKKLKVKSLPEAQKGPLNELLNLTQELYNQAVRIDETSQFDDHTENQTEVQK